MTTGKLAVLPTGRINPQALLEMAKDWNMSEVMIIGIDANGEFMCGSSEERERDLYYLLTRARLFLDRLNDGK